jgi:hypothetical protein
MVEGRLPVAVHRALKCWAVSEGCSVQWAVEEAVRQLLGIEDLDAPFSEA